MVCPLDIFSLTEHNAKKVINKLEKKLTVPYSIHLFIIVRFIIVSDSLNGPFINQMSQRHTVYSNQTLVGNHDAFYS